MKKTKIAYLTKTMPINGISTVIRNYCQNIDKNEFDITVITGLPIDDYYRQFYIDNGIKLIVLNGAIKNPVSYYCELFKYLRREKYDIVHIHGNSATICLELLMAMLCGQKIRIAHSHNSTAVYKTLHYFLYPFFRFLYTEGFACSTMAGKWMFRNNKFTVIPNGFDIKKFIFNEGARKEIREGLNIVEKFVIANVARFNDQKNHLFLLQVFESIAAKQKDAYLLLVGDGPNLPMIKKKIENCQYKDRIIYYGTTDEVEKIYSAADVFLLPSKYEGLGIVFIEAQISGLPVITSNVVPYEVNINGLAHFLSLSDPADLWADEVLKINQIERTLFYERNKESIDKYDIQKDARFLETIYRQLYQSRRKNK